VKRKEQGSTGAAISLVSLFDTTFCAWLAYLHVSQPIPFHCSTSGIIGYSYFSGPGTECLFDTEGRGLPIVWKGILALASNQIDTNQIQLCR